METIKGVLFTPLFYIFITLLAVIAGHVVEKLAKTPVVNRFLVALTLLLLFVILTGTTYDEYITGGKYITVFLGPATVALALPLYSQLKLLIEHKLVVLLSALTGVITSFASVFLTIKAFGLGSVIYYSTLSKSVTMPVALMLTETVGGVEGITMLAVSVAGIIGVTITPPLARLLKIKDKVAFGIAIGASSHVLGTSRALEIGEVEGAFSSLSLSVTAVFTVIAIPILIRFFPF